MPTIINIIAIGLAALFLTIPIINSRVFHTVNVDEIIVAGRDGLSGVQERLNKGDYAGARDSAQSLIERFRNDSLLIFTGDISSWDTVLSLIKQNRNDFGSDMLIPRLGQEVMDSVATCESGARMSQGVRQRITAALNAIKDDYGFFVSNSDSIRASDPRVKGMLDDLRQRGIVIERDGKNSLKSGLSPAEIRLLRRFHLLILEKAVYPHFLTKDLRRNRDWASEYIVQTAMFFVGASYRADHKSDDAVRVFDSLMVLFPTSIYAEILFLQTGQILYDDARNEFANGDRAAAVAKLSKAIGYLEKIEKNREVARDFPKYKHVELNPGTYVNADAASIAKRKIKEKSHVYSLAEEKNDLAGKGNEEKTGTTLEDAVKLISQCYVAMGKTDSARMELALFPAFFPESDNLDDAQKLIADSYAKDGEQILAADSTGAAAKKSAAENFARAVKEYQRFVNLYPQSDLASQVYIAMGDAYTKLGDPVNAARSFAAALDLAKEIEAKARVQLQIGEYYRERKEFAKAAAAYQVILTTYVSTDAASSAQYEIGVCREAMGDTAAAMDAFKQVIDRYKRSDFYAQAAFAVANWYFEAKNYVEALKYYRDGYNYAPQGGLASRMLLQQGYIWVKQAESGNEGERAEKYKEAIRQFGKVADEFGETHPRDADEANYQIAQCSMKIGNEQAAHQAAKKIQSRDIRIQSIKVFGVDVENPKEEITYWNGLYKDAVENEERASILIDKADVFNEKMKNYDSAAAGYIQALAFTTDESKKLKARVGLARVYTAQKKYPETQAVLDTVLANKKMPPELRQQLEIQLDDAYYKAKDHQKALNGFDDFAARYPDHKLTAYAHYRVGTIMSERKEPQKALDRFQVVVTKFKESDVYDKAILGIGEQMIALGKPQEGVKYLEDFLKGPPLRDTVSSASNMYLRIAETYNSILDNKAKALPVYEKVVAGYPDDNVFSYAAYQAGMIYKGQEKDKEALAAFKKVKREDAGIYRAAQAEIGKITAKTDPEAAIENYTQIVKQSQAPEDSILAMIGIGDVYVSVQKWDKAAETYQKVYTLFAGRDTVSLPVAVVRWVDALNNSKQYDKAIEAATIMQTKYPRNQYTVNTYYCEATAWFAKQNYSKAREAFLKLIELNKSEQLTEIAYFQKGDCFYFSAVAKGVSAETRNQRLKQAIGEYGDYLKRYPKGKYRASALYMQGTAYYTLEDFANARPRFQEIVSSHPDFPDICSAKNYLAYSLSHLDRWKEALRLYDEVIRNGSCSKAAHEFAVTKREAGLVKK